jgi:tRNA threonylcarbamoyl adenosine modification protein YeaZ
MTLLPVDKFALALHSSSPQLGLALTNYANICRNQTWNLDRALSSTLHTLLQEFLCPQTWQDLAFLGVDKGPGSFTSTRLGMVTARTLAQQLEIPLFALSSLEALAWSRSKLLKRHPSQVIYALQMNATQGKIYGAVYQYLDDRSPLITLVPDTIFTLDSWKVTLQELPSNPILVETPEKMGEIAISLLELAYLHWQKGDRPHWSVALPFYG